MHVRQSSLYRYKLIFVEPFDYSNEKFTWIKWLFKFLLFDIEQCCDTIELSSTTNAGHSNLGTYTKKTYDNDGRAVYYNGAKYLYWLSAFNMWVVSFKLFFNQSYFYNISGHII